jgi:hypothetical protein
MSVAEILASVMVEVRDLPARSAEPSDAESITQATSHQQRFEVN